MFFLYADASGNAKVHVDRSNNGLYVLTGVIVHENDWQTIENKLTQLKINSFPDVAPSEWELHAYEIWNNIKFFKKINLDKKLEIFESLVQLICESNITIVATALDKEKMKIRYAIPKTMEYAWTFLIERYDHFLNSQPAITNNGLVFMDSDQNNIESQIKTILSRLVRRGSYWQAIEHVIEDPIFTKSHLRTLIQLSDVIAYFIHRHLTGHADFEKWFNSISKKMYQPEGDIYKYGLKLFP